MSAIDSATPKVPFATLLADYPEPVHQLLTLSDIDWTTWLDYPTQFGFTVDHVPDLIRLATDTRFDIPASDWPIDQDPFSAPNHALRALGQLKSLDAVPSLIPLFEKDDDLLFVDLPKTFVLLGPSVIPALSPLLLEPTPGKHTREGVAETLGKIAKTYPETRETCLAPILAVLRAYADNSPDFNGMLLFPLIEMKAVEAASLIQEAFDAHCINEKICGDWLIVKHDLGVELTPEESQEYHARQEAFRRRFLLNHRTFQQEESEISNRYQATLKAKSKRKAIKAARRKNRRK